MVDCQLGANLSQREEISPVTDTIVLMMAERSLSRGCSSVGRMLWNSLCTQQKHIAFIANKKLIGR